MMTKNLLHNMTPEEVRAWLAEQRRWQEGLAATPARPIRKRKTPPTDQERDLARYHELDESR